MKKDSNAITKVCRSALLSTALVAAPAPLVAFDNLTFTAPSADDDLLDALRAASLLVEAESDGESDALSLFAAARADYGRILGALYAEGYYSGVINITIDGREASVIAPLDAPDRIGAISVTVSPGPQFTFGQARMRPYAPGTDLPTEYRDGEPAYSTAIVDAANAGVEGWRNIGHAKAAVADQRIVADHRQATLDSAIELAPGPRLRFGTMSVAGQERMRVDRIRKIAGFPQGEVFDPEELDKVANRLRRTGAFQTVALTEATSVGPGNTLDVELLVAEEKLRRFGFGAEFSSSDGAGISGYWLHRNLFGGAERLRVDGAVDRIGSENDNLGYELGFRIERPGTPVTDSSAFIEARAKREEIVDLTVDSVELGFGLTRTLSDTLSAELGLFYVASRAKDVTGTYDYERIALPFNITWDNRDDPLDATEGYYLSTDLTPFYGLGSTGSGAQVMADARAYRGFGRDDRLVVAGRVQLGTVTGTDITDTPPDYLFYSGGGGSVRGQPYQSLGVPLARPAGAIVQSGGMSFVGISGELRFDVTETIGAVAFYDAGYITDDGLFGGNTASHSGAGIGLRYNTGIGPIRLDVGLPVSGSTGDGAQIYVGIGQTF